MQQTVTYIPGYIQHHQHLTDNADVVGNKQDIFSVQ
jgi:hypothetical protein